MNIAAAVAAAHCTYNRNASYARQLMFGVGMFKQSVASSVCLAGMKPSVHHMISACRVCRQSGAGVVVGHSALQMWSRLARVVGVQLIPYSVSGRRRWRVNVKVLVQALTCIS
jgi:hypothetical protein